MKFKDIVRKETTPEERRKLRKEYNAWRDGRILICDTTWVRFRNRAHRQQQGRCYYCWGRFKKRDMHVDHRVPVFYGGPNDICNYILACRSCNIFKAQHYLLRDKDKLSYSMEKATIHRIKKIDYTEQEELFAETLHNIIDSEMRLAMALDGN